MCLFPLSAHLKKVSQGQGTAPWSHTHTHHWWCIRGRARTVSMKCLILHLNPSSRAASAKGQNFLPQFCEPRVWIHTRPRTRQAIQVGSAARWLGEATTSAIYKCPLEEKKCHQLKAIDWDPQNLAYNNDVVIHRTIMNQMNRNKDGIEKIAKVLRYCQKL